MTYKVVVEGIVKKKAEEVIREAISLSGYKPYGLYLKTPEMTPGKGYIDFTVTANTGISREDGRLAGALLTFCAEGFITETSVNVSIVTYKGKIIWASKYLKQFGGVEKFELPA